MNDKKIIHINIDDELINSLIIEQLKNEIERVKPRKLYYDLNDLVKITGFSRSFILKTFFHDKRFKQIRRKVGTKWVFPVEETNEFLIQWISEQPHN